MDPPCPERDGCEGTNQILLATNEDDKTDNKQEEINIEHNDRQPIDEIERKDFEEENRIINNCMEEGNEASKTPDNSGSKPTLNINNEHLSKPGCSRQVDDDSDSSIQKLVAYIQYEPYYKPNIDWVTKTTISGEDNSSTIILVPKRKFNETLNKGKPTKPIPRTKLFQDECLQGQEVQRPDFMEKLLSSGTEEKKDLPKGKLYKGEQMHECYENLMEGCEMEEAGVGESGRTNSNASSIASSSSDSTKDFSVPSTSNAERLLGLNDATKRDEPSTSKPEDCNQQDCEGHDDADENGECVCTCLSDNDDDSEEITDSEPEEKPSRKRRGDITADEGQQPKRHFPESQLPEVGWSGPLNPPSAPTNCPPELQTWLNRFSTWSNVEKTQALDALIRRCDATQVRHMMDTIKPLFQRDFISLLPKELALAVLGYLEPKDLLRAAQTCRYWRFLAEDNLLWKEQCHRIGITSLRKYTHLPRWVPRCNNPWKAAFVRQVMIENNWLHKPLPKPVVLRGHEDHVITCLQFSGNRILSGSDDTTLKVWSAVSGRCLRTLVGHSGGVWSSQMHGTLVISGSTDRTLRVWNAESGQCLKVLTGHTSTVRCMHLHKNKVVSGSRDATLRVWSIPDGRCLRVLVGHMAAVRCVQYNGKLVVSGAYDYFVKVWNPNSGECLHTLAGHTNRVYSLQFDGVHVVSGSLDTSIRVWDVQTGQLKHTLTGHQSLTSGMELHSNILVSGNADSTVKVWDITTGHCLHTLTGPNKHQSAVTCLQSSNRFVITSSDDGTVKLWNVRTGEFIRNLVELSSGGSGGVVWRIRANATKLVCAVGSRNGTEETKLMVLNFDLPRACRKCDSI